VCIAYLVEPSVLRTESHWVDVETDGELTLGRTVVDTRRPSGGDGGQANARVALGADDETFVRVLFETFARQ